MQLFIPMHRPVQQLACAVNSGAVRTVLVDGELARARPDPKTSYRRSQLGCGVLQAQPQAASPADRVTPPCDGVHLSSPDRRITVASKMFTLPALREAVHVNGETAKIQCSGGRAAG